VPAGPLLIGIAGGSGSGKTTLAVRLAAVLGATTLVAVDAYYRDLAELDPALREDRNFDVPEALDHELMLGQLAELARGRTVELPGYRFETHTRTAAGRTVRPGRYVLLEGLFALYWPALRDLLDLKIFVDAPHDLCLARRVERDTAERGRTPESVRLQYARTVRPMYERYVLPTRAYADLVLDGTRPVREMVDRVLEGLG
jgi:uridine kinase